MRKIREVLRLKYECELTHRAISAACGLSKGSVSTYLQRARDAGVTWASARELDDAALEAKLFKETGRNVPRDRYPIDLGWVHRELRRKEVTLQRLWVEYCEAARTDPAQRRPYQYSQFCDRYATYRGRVDVTMRQVYRAGEKMLVDYSGRKPTIQNRETGEVIEVELFVAVLGASNYTYAEAAYTQKLPDWIASNRRALEYFGGVPEIIVPDQLRSAVKGPDRLDPEINPTYAEFAEHYGTAIVPARPRKPRDKAKAETAVQVVQRWILACLRNRTFFSLAELNEAIAELLEKLNERPFRALEGCRRSAFEELDKPALRPLPKTPYEVAEWKHAKVNIDYHVEFDHRLYSVPHALVGVRVAIRATTATVEILHEGRRVASHARSYARKGTPVTITAHRPKSHRQYGAWPPSRVLGWAEKFGPSVRAVVEHILDRHRHPESGYRSCMALIRDTKRYSPERVDAACRRALEIGAPSRRSVVHILKNNLENAPLERSEPTPPVVHDNVRGGAYYDRKEDQLNPDKEE